MGHYILNDALQVQVKVVSSLENLALNAMKVILDLLAFETIGASELEVEEVAWNNLFPHMDLLTALRLDKAEEVPFDNEVLKVVFEYDYLVAVVVVVAVVGVLIVWASAGVEDEAVAALAVALLTEF